ncbi:MAG: hypothetical protein ABWZ40_13935 [Caulobacterales bacterium]
MRPESSEANYFKDRAQREIALAEATGAKAHASVDFKTVYVMRRDGSQETVRIPQPDKSKKPN